MTLSKSSLTRVLRSKFTIPNPRAFGEAGHALTGTTRNVTSAGTTTRISTPPICTAQDFRSQSRRSPNPAPQTFGKGQQTPFDNLLNNITTHLTTIPATSRNPHIPYLHSLLRDYESNPSHWSKYAHANPEKQYTRNLVCEVPGVLNLLLLVWTPGRKSPVHDHADAHCLMKILKGEIRETRFAIPNFPGLEGPLVETSSVRYGTGKVSYMADSLGLHSISNPHSTEYAVSLHLYTPPNAALRGCHVYDEHDGNARHVLQGAYDSICGVVPAMSQ